MISSEDSAAYKRIIRLVFGLSCTIPSGGYLIRKTSCTNLRTGRNWSLCPMVSQRPQLATSSPGADHLEQRLHLYYDPGRALPVGDPKGIFVTVALGVFIRHLSIAAANTCRAESLCRNSWPHENDSYQADKICWVAIGSETNPESAWMRELIKKRRILQACSTTERRRNSTQRLRERMSFPSGHEVSCRQEDSGSYYPTQSTNII